MCVCVLRSSSEVARPGVSARVCVCLSVRLRGPVPLFGEYQSLDFGSRMPMCVRVFFGGTLLLTWDSKVFLCVFFFVPPHAAPKACAAKKVIQSKSK